LPQQPQGRPRREILHHFADVKIAPHPRFRVGCDCNIEALDNLARKQLTKIMIFFVMRRGGGDVNLDQGIGELREWQCSFIDVVKDEQLSIFCPYMIEGMAKQLDTLQHVTERA
jgi:hypothetical protein